MSNHNQELERFYWDVTGSGMQGLTNGTHISGKEISSESVNISK